MAQAPWKVVFLHCVKCDDIFASMGPQSKCPMCKSFLISYNGDMHINTVEAATQLQAEAEKCDFSDTLLKDGLLLSFNHFGQNQIVQMLQELSASIKGRMQYDQRAAAREKGYEALVKAIHDFTEGKATDFVLVCKTDGLVEIFTKKGQSTYDTAALTGALIANMPHIWNNHE